VLSAADSDGRPLLLLSQLAEHTKNIEADDRVSLLFDGTQGLVDPLTGPRATVQGRIARTDERRDRARYLARHPSAEQYADFGDFAFYVVEPTRVHLVAGFGRIIWIDGGSWPYDRHDAEALSAHEAAIVDHMNTDHADTLALYATALLGQVAGPWRMIGIDPEGIDLGLNGRPARLAFDTPVADPQTARKALVKLAGIARERTNAAQ
jgi:putative heme iron utilization protein